MGDEAEIRRIARCVEGESGAFDALIREFSPLVSSALAGALYRYGVPAGRQDVEDLHNGLFLALMEDDFRRLRQFQGRSSLGAYLRVIAVRYAVDFLRKQKSLVSLDCETTAPHPADPGATPDRVLESTQKEATVRRVIAGLRPQEQLLLKLVYGRELPPARVCEILGVSMTAYYNKKSRLLRKMRRLCEEFPPAASQ